MTDLVFKFEQVSMDDVDKVGGKNASLGEMISHLTEAGVRVPGGFATTSAAFWAFLSHGGLQEKINAALEGLNVEDVVALQKTGSQIRQWIRETDFPEDLQAQIVTEYEVMMSKGEHAVAVRSSATAEDLPDASFAGQQESYLNVVGLDNVLAAIKDVFASLYNDRAISYREHHGFAHHDVALSAGVQKMARSDLGASGVMFTLDTESGADNVVFITASYGLGETVVQGAVNPDEFYVSKTALSAGRPSVLKRNLGSKLIKMVYQQATDFKKAVETVDVSPELRELFSLKDEHVEELAKFAMIIEKHYGRPMDIEWALDGEDDKLYILQARPETVESRKNMSTLERYQLNASGEVIAEGRAIGQKIGAGKAHVVSGLEDMHKVQPGEVLVTDMTDPDWEPIMKRAAAIVTNRGGRTCHAAIIARELGIPAIVGCGDATTRIKHGDDVTVSCAEGDTGHVYSGQLDFEVVTASVDNLPDLDTKLMMNVGNPHRALYFSRLPNQGVGLARLEFIINNMIGVHPKALLEFDKQPDELKAEIMKRVNAYNCPVDFYVQKIIEGVAMLGAAFEGKPVIVRMSDFKSNEYANLLGGSEYEPEEENPMIGFRGTSRYLSDSFEACFELECQALKYVRDEMGMTNIEIMIPFVRTLDEARDVVALLAKYGLRRGENGLRLIMMCEIPSNAVLAEEFLEYFDGFSIGSNDMTQLSLGLDRDSGLIAHLFSEQDPAVKKLIKMALDACQKQGKYIGICGQGPSDFPEFAEWLYDNKISSLSLNPDTVVGTWQQLAKG